MAQTTPDQTEQQTTSQPQQQQPQPQAQSPQKMSQQQQQVQQQKQPPAYERSPVTSSLVEVIDRILDKGLVIDAWVRVSLVGIELLTIEARVVVASVDTYLRYADALGKTKRIGGGGE